MPSLDLTVEGSAAIVRDGDILTRAATVYATKYDWHVTVRDGAFHSDGGADRPPDRPPFDRYRVTPTLVFSFGTDDTFTVTRWRFGLPGCHSVTGGIHDSYLLVKGVSVWQNSSKHLVPRAS